MVVGIRLPDCMVADLFECCVDLWTQCGGLRAPGQFLQEDVPDFVKA